MRGLWKKDVGKKGSGIKGLGFRASGASGCLSLI